MIEQNKASNFEAFRDSLSTLVIERLAPASSSSRGSGKCTKTKRSGLVKRRKNGVKPALQGDDDGREDENDAAELSEFIEYLSEEIFLSFPPNLRSLSYATLKADSNTVISHTYSLPVAPALLETLVSNLPPSTPDSLLTYKLIPSPCDLEPWLEKVLSAYIITTTSPPPEHDHSLGAAVAAGCEICEREHLPLTYHHLIPRAMHAKAVKRGWAQEWELQKVAWLCRACHSFVHKIATNEELAREWCSVEALMEREDVMRWAQWAGRVRWKAR